MRETTTPKNHSVEQSSERFDRIVEYAMELFLKQGIKLVRMDDIALGLGISKRTLYETVGSREELIKACIRHRQQQQQHFRRTIDNSSANLIEAYITTFTEQGESMRANIRLVMELKRYYPALFEQIYTEGLERARLSLTIALEQGLEQGLFIDMIDPQQGAALFSKMLHQLLFEESIHEMQAELGMYPVLSIILFFFRGIATERGRELIDYHLQQLR